jgi:hypothetical protein
MKMTSINLIMVFALSVGSASAGVFDDTFSLSSGVVAPPKSNGFDQFKLSPDSSFGCTNGFPFAPKTLADANLSLQTLVPQSGVNYSLQIGKPGADTNYCLQIWKPTGETNYVIQVFR